MMASKEACQNSSYGIYENSSNKFGQYYKSPTLIDSIYL